MLAALLLTLVAQAATQVPQPPTAPARKQIKPELPPVPERFQSDDSPTAYACSWETALRGDDCSFEAAPAKGDPRTNARLALAALSRACAAETQNEAILRACEEEGERLARSWVCALQGVRLADEAGHLVQAAADCAEGLRRVIARTRAQVQHELDCLGDDCGPRGFEGPLAPPAQPAHRAPKRAPAAAPPDPPHADKT